MFGPLPRVWEFPECMFVHIVHMHVVHNLCVLSESHTFNQLLLKTILFFWENRMNHWKTGILCGHSMQEMIIITIAHKIAMLIRLLARVGDSDSSKAIKNARHRC